MKEEVFAQILDIQGNNLIVDTQIAFINGMTVIQRADYLFKYSYSQGKIAFFAKRGTDQDFTLLVSKDITLTSEALFLRFYTNQEHKISFDFVDITDNLTYKLLRKGNQQESDRVIDLAFAESASELQSEAQIIEEDSNGI